MTQEVWEREAETGRHISLPLWCILQGYRSQSAWSWLSLTCYESKAGPGWSITLGGGSRGESAAGGGGRRARVWVKPPCCLSLTMHRCMTANLVWPVHNGRSAAALYEQSVLLPAANRRGEVKRSQNTVDEHYFCPDPIRPLCWEAAEQVQIQRFHLYVLYLSIYLYNFVFYSLHFNTDICTTVLYLVFQSRFVTVVLMHLRWLIDPPPPTHTHTLSCHHVALQPQELFETKWRRHTQKSQTNGGFHK